MPWGVAAAAVGSAVGAGVSSALAPSPSGGGGSGSYYVPTGLNTADTAWQNLLGSTGQTYGNAAPWIGTTAGDALSNALAGNAQYGTGYMNAANAAGQQYGNLGSNLTNAANLQFGQQQGLINAGQQVYNTAFDPQSALYNRTVQQLQDQTGATNSMYGLGSSAAGAGVANQALGNFNIDWQNQQLQRQLAGLQGYGQAVSGAGQAGAQGGALGAAGAGATLQGGQVPWQVNQQINTQPTQLLNQYAGLLNTGVYGPAEGIQGSIIPYLNYGQGAQSVPFQQQTQGAGAAGALASQGISQGISGLGNAYQNAGSFGNLFGGTTGSFGGGDFSGAFTSSPYYSGGGGNSYGFTM